VKRIPPERLVFLDESGLNLSMGRSHAWVKKGQELVARRPMNWGKNLTLLGAMRSTGWVLISSMFQSVNSNTFVWWLGSQLLRRLNRSDVLVLDNLPAHKDPRVGPLCAANGIKVLYLPPYSLDFNPIEPGWAFRSSTCVGMPREPSCPPAYRAPRQVPRHPSALPPVVRSCRLPGSTQVITGVRCFQGEEIFLFKMQHMGC